MADSPLTALPQATTPLANTDMLYVVQDGVSKKVPAEIFNPSGSSGQLQFNLNGAFAADSGLSYDRIGGALNVGGAVAVASAPVVNAAQTWNNAGVAFTALKVNVTNTASAAGSLLMDLQVGGSSKFSVGKDGGITTNHGIAVNADGVRSPGGAFVGARLYIGAGGSDFSAANARFVVDDGAVVTRDGGFFGISSGFQGITTASADVRLYRDAANTLAQRNGVNAQTSRLYGTYTDASNYRRLTQTMSMAGVAEIKPEGAGTGASGNVLHISGLPTSNPGAGILWNDNGTVKVGT